MRACAFELQGTCTQISALPFGHSCKIAERPGVSIHDNNGCEVITLLPDRCSVLLGLANNHSKTADDHGQNSEKSIGGFFVAE